MSDEDKDVEIESDDIDDDDLGNSIDGTPFATQAEKRAHHNALERKRRDHIKDSFSSLRDSVPSLQGEKVNVSRAQILKKAAEYIVHMRKKNQVHQSDISDLKRQNEQLQGRIRGMERTQNTGNYVKQANNVLNARAARYNKESESEGSELEEQSGGRRKKLKT